MKVSPKASIRDKNWYDSFYSKPPVGFPSWYKFLVPDLVKQVKDNPNCKILELGCGQSMLLQYLVKNKILKEENIYGLDQSKEAVRYSKKILPRAKLKAGDIYKLPYNKNTFDIVLLMETIEHLENPIAGLLEARKVLKKNGLLYISFPNYIHLPWLLVRILSEKLNRPSWIVLQPVDKFYTTINVIDFCRKLNMKFQKIIGSTYFPPLTQTYEPLSITNLFNRMKLGHFSFHPILRFMKSENK